MYRLSYEYVSLIRLLWDFLQDFSFIWDDILSTILFLLLVKQRCYSYPSDLVFLLVIYLSFKDLIFFFLQSLSYWPHLWFSEIQFYFQNSDFWTFYIRLKFHLEK